MRDVIALGYHQALVPAAELARRGGFQAHTVRRIIQGLHEEEIISTKAFIDVYRLGYTQFEVSYAIASSSAGAAERFLQTLQASPLVAWIGAYSGEYQYILTACCRSPQELFRFTEETTAHPGVSITDRRVAVRVRYTEFPLTIFSRHVQNDTPLVFGVAGDERIDETDHAILSQLSEDAAISSRDLARWVSLSQSTVIQRIRALEQRGIIVGYTYVIDFSRLGFQAFCIIISTTTHTVDLTARIIAFARKRKTISYVSESIGAYDFKFGVLLEDPSQILALAHEISEAFVREITQLTTLTAFDYRKVSRYPIAQSPR